MSFELHISQKIVTFYSKPNTLYVDSISAEYKNSFALGQCHTINLLLEPPSFLWALIQRILKPFVAPKG